MKRSKILAVIATIGAVTAVLFAADRPIETRWGVGHIVYAVPLRASPKKPGNWDIRTDDEIEIGLRSDGVVVWRKMPARE